MRGKGVVLVGEDEWAAIEETLYLTGIPGMVHSLIDGRDAPHRGVHRRVRPRVVSV